MTRQIEIVNPVDFVGVDGRLLIDTSVFMDDDPTRKGGLKSLLMHCGETIRRVDNPIVIPSDVVEELTRQSRKVDADRTEAIRRAGIALDFIEDAKALGLVRTDIGRASNHYADSVFDAIFKLYANRYDLCLLVNDITPLLQVRLMSTSSDRRLVAGVLNSDGLIEVEDPQSLFERGERKLRRKQLEKDAREVAVLEPLLASFQDEFGTTAPPAPAPAMRRSQALRPTSRRPRQVIPFNKDANLQPADRLIDVGHVPAVGDKVHFKSPSISGSVVLDAVIGEGGEGKAYAVEGDRVVKIFDREHLTQHRKEKVQLLVSRRIELDGVCLPEAVVTNDEGEFVGYLMPKARGNEFRVIMNPRRFLKTFPGWKKADLVDVCISFLEKVAYLHSLNVILGDINPKNVIVDANKDVWIIDADSWQIEGYPCPVGTPMFTAASAQGKAYAESLRTEDGELFAVATMLFMVLITGQFPYARAGSDGDIVRLVKEGNFAFQVGQRSNRDQPEGNWKYMWSHMPRDLKEMFWNTFHREGNRYAAPPTANEWLQAFRRYKRWLASDKNFDPMSNDVYPFRFKAFRWDTPIEDCPQCARPHALVGEWNEATQTHTTPATCFDCGQKNRPRCADCGTPRPEGALRDGRCRDCNRKRDFGSCERCGKETPHRYLAGGRCSGCQLGTCKDCGSSVLKSDLSYGRCKACEQKARLLDPSRLCADCHQPFITFEHASWFAGKGLDVAKSHAAIRKDCHSPTNRPVAKAPTGTPRPGSAAPRQGTTKIAGPAKATPTPPVSQPTQSVWSRLKQWWTS